MPLFSAAIPEANLYRKRYTYMLNAAAFWLQAAVMNFDVFPIISYIICILSKYCNQLSGSSSQILLVKSCTFSSVGLIYFIYEKYTFHAHDVYDLEGRITPSSRSRGVHLLLF